MFILFLELVKTSRENGRKIVEIDTKRRRQIEDADLKTQRITNEKLKAELNHEKGLVQKEKLKALIMQRQAEKMKRDLEQPDSTRKVDVLKFETLSKDRNDQKEQAFGEINSKGGDKNIGSNGTCGK